ncbi:hypothetical protein JCM15519_20600 [Fundidesulfovibrio butyratiphilus]
MKTKGLGRLLRAALFGALFAVCVGCSTVSGIFTQVSTPSGTTRKQPVADELLPSYITNFALAAGDVIKIEAVSSLYKGAAYRLEANNTVQISLTYGNAPYKIMTGDALRVAFALDAAPPFDAMVRPDGKITLPGIGEITAAGSTPEALAGKIANAYTKVMTTPQCTVTLQSMNTTAANAIQGDYTILPDGNLFLPVLGRFTAAGRTPGELAQSIAEATLKHYGNKFVVSVVPSQVTPRWQAAFERQVMVNTSGDIVLPVLGSQKVAGLTLEDARAAIRRSLQQFSVNPVEVNLTLLSSTHRTVFVSGQVRSPGSFPLTTGLTSLKAIMAAGGVTTEGSLDEVVIIHRDAVGDVTIYKTNLSEVINKSAGRQDISLAPQDIVFVPKTRVAQANQFIDQYVTRMLPFTRSISYSYNRNFNPANE